MVVVPAGLVMDIKPRIISAEVKRTDHAAITADVHTYKPHIAGEYVVVLMWFKFNNFVKYAWFYEQITYIMTFIFIKC